MSRRRLPRGWQNALKKNPALEQQDFDGIVAGSNMPTSESFRLFSTNSTLWTDFEGRFSNKDGLNKKFDQLAELRNGIRHSRSVHEVARKEGEGSILWFEEVLAKN